MALSSVLSWLRGKKQQHSARTSCPRRNPRFGTKLPTRLEVELLEAREAPATDIWTSASNGNWTNGANWQGGVAPHTGDDLVFPGQGSVAITATNDFPAGTQFGSITFNNGGSVAQTKYTLGGNPVTLSGNITDENLGGQQNINLNVAFLNSATINAPQALGNFSTDTGTGQNVNGNSIVFNGAVSLGSNALTFNCGGNIILNGAVDGLPSSQIIKQNIGQVFLQNNDSNFSGTTTISNGVLWGGTTNSLGTGNVTVANGATLGLEGGTWTNTITALGAGFGGQGALFCTNCTFNGTLNVSGNITIGCSNGGSFYFSTGTMNQVGASPNWSLTKTGLGQLRFDTPVSLTGPTIINGGELDLANGGTLATSAITLIDGAGMVINNTGSIVNNRIPSGTQVTMNAGYLVMQGHNGATGTQTFGNLILQGGYNFIQMDCNNGNSAGTQNVLTFAGLNRAAGNGATINFSWTNNISLGTDNGSVQNMILFTAAPTLVTTGTSAGVIPYATEGQNENPNGQSQSQEVTYLPAKTASLHGIVGLNDAGNGGAVIAAAPSINAATSNNNVIYQGFISETINANTTINSLSSFNGGSIQIASGVTLTIGSGGITSVGAQLQFYGGGGTGGTLQFQSPAAIGEGFICGDSQFQIGNSNSTQDVNIVGTVGLTVSLGNGINFYMSNYAKNNTYTGITQVDAGQIALNGGPNIIGIPGNMIIGSNRGYLNNFGRPNEYVYLNNYNQGQIPSTVNMTILGGGNFSLPYAYGTITIANLTMKASNSDGGANDWQGDAIVATPNSTLAVTGTINILAPDTTSYLFAGRAEINYGQDNYGFGGNTLQLAPAGVSTTFNIAPNPSGNAVSIGDVVTGSAGITVTGGGTLQLRENNTYSGPTQITSGTVTVLGSQNSSAVTVGAGGTLRGGNLGNQASVGTISVSGTVAPGGTPMPNNVLSNPDIGYSSNLRGSLHVQGGTTFNNGSTLDVEVAGYNASDPDYDTLVTTGALTIFTGTTLLVDLNGLSQTGKAPNVLQFGSIAGGFTTVQVINNPHNFQVTLNQTANGIDIVVGAAPADLSITNTDNTTTTVPGATRTYTVVVTNTGPNAVTGVSVSALVPANVTSATWTAVASPSGGPTGFSATGNGNIHDTNVSMPVGSTITYTVTATISNSAAYGSTIVYTATVAAPAGVDSNAANNTATDTDTVSNPADLSITNTDNTTITAPGVTRTYTVVVTNNGPNAVTGVTISDPVPANVSSATWTAVSNPSGGGGPTGFSASGNGDISDSGVSMPNGSTITYTIIAVISNAAASGSTVDYAATVAAPAGVDSNLANNSATDSDTVQTPIDLAITNTDGTTSTAPGATRTYIVVVTNNGPGLVTGVVVQDAVPANVTTFTYTSQAAGGATGNTANSGAINDTLSMPNGSTVTYTITAVISNTAGNGSTITNTATVAAAAFVDSNPANNTATDVDTVQTAVDLKITSSSSIVGNVSAGTFITYTITATNLGPVTATGATILDVPPAGLINVTYTAVGSPTSGVGAPSGFSTSGGGSINDTVTMPVGSTITYTVSATVGVAASGTLNNTATITPPANLGDTNLLNNTQTASNTVKTTENSFLVVAPNSAKSPGTVVVYNALTGTVIETITAFPKNGITTVAMGDINNDGIPDIIAAQAGVVETFLGTNNPAMPWSQTVPSQTFFPFYKILTIKGVPTPEKTYTGVLALAVGPLDAIPGDDLVVAMESGTSNVMAFSGAAVINNAAPIANFRAYKSGAVSSLALGNFVPSSPFDEIVTAPTAVGSATTPIGINIFASVGNNFPGKVSASVPTPPSITVAAPLPTYSGIDPNHAGLSVAAGDFNSDGTVDLLVGPGKTSQPIAVYNGLTLGTSRSTLTTLTPPGLTASIAVCALDVSGDGVPDIVLARSLIGNTGFSGFNLLGLAAGQQFNIPTALANFGLNIAGYEYFS